MNSNVRKLEQKGSKIVGLNIMYLHPMMIRWSCFFGISSGLELCQSLLLESGLSYLNSCFDLFIFACPIIFD